MELVHHGTCKASKFASEDIISRMPKDIMSNILDRLPIQDAVKTGILSRNWMYSWTTRSQLVFDEEFFKYLLRKNAQHLFNKENLGSLLLHLKSSITKFVLYIPDKGFADIVENIGHWILFLFTKRLKEFVLINKLNRTLQLPCHFFSCPQLKHLKLRSCSLYPAPAFHGFPNLLRSDLHMVNFEGCNYEEFIASYRSNGEVKPAEIVKLENFKIKTLLMCKLDSMAITGSNIFQLMGFLPKLEELDVDCRILKLLDKRVHVTLPCLKTLTLDGLDFGCNKMVSSAYGFINGSPNLQTLRLKAIHTVRYLLLPRGYWEVECGITGMLQLQNVELEGIGESEIEVCFIKSLLANSFLLKNMVIIHRKPSPLFRSMLLKLHRASPIAKIHFVEF